MLTTPEGCTDVQASSMARKMAGEALRKNASTADLREVLEALGLAEPVSPVSLPVRDTIGPLRESQAPAIAIPGPPSELPPGCTWCHCPEPHILTPASSDTTYVDPRGNRNCRVARRRIKRNTRARAAARKGTA